MRAFLLASTALVASAGLSGVANAQAASAQPASPAAAPNNAEPATSQSAASSSGLEDIVVTATRRPAGLQSVPITIQAVTASTLKAFNVTGVLSLPSLVSGLVVTPSGGNNIYLRGIGSASTGYNEAQTAVYIDGLYLANPALSIYSFNNIDRIEVLKGPQGTLYGRNATAGLISVITRDPGTTTRLDASVGYANYDTFTANLYAATPISETLSANIALFHQKQSKGWTLNTFTGNDIQKSDESGVQAKLVWRPSSDTKITLGGIYDYNNRNFGYAYQTYPGTLANDGTPFLGKYLIASRIDPSAPFHAYIASLKVEQDYGFATLTSLTGYQTSNQNVTFAGGSPAVGQPFAGQSAAPTVFYQQNKTFSQEFQLVSKPSPSRLDWVLGAFYYNDRTRLRLDSFTSCAGTVCAPGTPTRNDGRPATVSYSVFGDVGYRFFKATHVTVGLRYTDETRSLIGLVTPLAGLPNSVAALPPAATCTTAGTVFFPGQPFPGAVGCADNPQTGIPTTSNFKRLTYRFVIAQDIGRDVHLFASHNLGFKSGAYNGNAFNNPPVRPELLYATEAGIKSELFDRRVRLNASYFHYTYKDVQVRSMAPPAAPGNALLLNVAKERIDGVDIDLNVVPVRGLTLNGAFEFLDAKYEDFPGTTCVTPGPNVSFTNPTTGAVVLRGTVVNTPCNLAGARPQFAAPFSATVGAVYNFETGIGSFTLSANDHYTASYPTAAQYVRQDPHHIVDASVGWTSSNKRFDAQLFVKNLTDEYTYAIGQAATSFTVAPGPPRTYGVSVGVHL